MADHQVQPGASYGRPEAGRGGRLGGKSALVSVPHSQRRRSATCSVTSARRSGRSNTCLTRSRDGASPRPAPQHPHRMGSGPPCGPRGRPERDGRRDRPVVFLAGDPISFASIAVSRFAPLGPRRHRAMAVIDEFLEFRPWLCSSSAIRASIRSTRERSSTFSAESLAFSAVRVAFSATGRAHSANSSSLRVRHLPHLHSERRRALSGGSSRAPPRSPPEQLQETNVRLWPICDHRKWPLRSSSSHRVQRGVLVTTDDMTSHHPSPLERREGSWLAA